ncbi:hypothetical protein ACTXT7_009921 [Hymenolepis weldensis]
MTMPDTTLQEQPKSSLKNLAGNSCITHHILPIFSCTNRLSSFQEFTESFNGTKAYFKWRGRNPSELDSNPTYFPHVSRAKFPITILRLYSAPPPPIVLTPCKLVESTQKRIYRKKGCKMCNKARAAVDPQSLKHICSRVLPFSPSQNIKRVPIRPQNETQSNLDSVLFSPHFFDLVNYLAK